MIYPFPQIIWRVVRVVEGAALEMLCPERDLGFESLTLRHRRHKLCIACDDFFIKNHLALTPLLLLSPKSLPTFRGPHEPVTMRVCWTFLFCSSSENTAKSWKEQAVFWRELDVFFGFFPPFEPISYPALLLSAISAHLLPKSTVSGSGIPLTIACAEDSLEL